MKKILLLVLALGLIFTLAACSENDEAEATPTPQPPAETPIEDDSQNDDDYTSTLENEEADEEYEPIEDPENDEGYDTTPDDNAEAPIEDSNDSSTDDDTRGDSGGVALGLTIELLIEEEAGPGPLADLTFMHTVDLDATFAFVGDTLMIRTFTPLRDFAVILIERDIGADYDIIIPVEIIGDVVESFLPTEGFIIYNYMSVGTMPNRAITFLDENGQRHFFFIIQNQGYPETGDRYILHEFQVEVVTELFD